MSEELEGRALALNPRGHEFDSHFQLILKLINFDFFLIIYIMLSNKIQQLTE